MGDVAIGHTSVVDAREGPAAYASHAAIADSEPQATGRSSSRRDTFSVTRLTVKVSLPPRDYRPWKLLRPFGSGGIRGGPDGAAGFGTTGVGALDGVPIVVTEGDARGADDDGDSLFLVATSTVAGSTPQRQRGPQRSARQVAISLRKR